MASVNRLRPLGIGLGAALGLGLSAVLGCEQAEEPEPPVIEAVYLLDRVNDAAPPAAVCEAGEVAQVLRFESIALAEDGSYGRLQETQIGGGTPIQQEERGEYERAAEVIELRPAGGGLVLLALLDSAGAFARRIHACGDTLRYQSVPVED